MSVSNLIADLSRQDVRLWVQDGQLQFDGPEATVTADVLAKLRQHKAGILAYMAKRAVGEQAAEDDPTTQRIDELVEEAWMQARRQEVLKIMADDPNKKYAYFTDIDTDPDFVILAIGIRGVATFEMKIPRARYHPFVLLEILGREH